MSAPNQFFASDINDVARYAAFAEIGDHIYNIATDQLFIQTSTGPQAILAKQCANVPAFVDTSSSIVAGASYSQADMQAVKTELAALAQQINAMRNADVVAGQMVGP